MRRHLVHRSLRRAVSAVCGVALVAALTGADVSSRAAHAATSGPPPVQLGVYTNPGAKNVVGAQAFAQYAGAPVTRVLDFLSHSTWLDMTRIGWALTPYTGQGYQLELSVPMLPNEPGVSLASCAAGSYDQYWRSIATSVMTANLPTTEIRPGWEMNGNWFSWTAINRTESYAGCFRKMVTAMRSVPGQQFTFAFSPALGAATAPAVDGYPGDAYVDDISPDLYDQSWAFYPTPAGWTTLLAQTKSWNWMRSGTGGLDFWSAFARTHGKPLAISEWGLAWRSDGHGGNDNAYFVDRMFDYVSDPANNVRYFNYFNSPDSSTLKHDIMRADTVFPVASQRFQARSAASAPVSVPAAPAPAPAPVSVPAAPQSTVVAAPSLLTRPAVTGRSVVRSRLTATPGSWRPAAQTMHYQWFRGTQAIPGATSTRYAPRNVDRDRRLRVRVTASRTGSAGVSAWSAYTARVRG